MSFFWDLFIVNLIYLHTFPFTYYDNCVKALLRPIAKCCSNDYKIVPSVYHKLPQRSLQMRKLYRNTATLVMKYVRYYEMLQLRTLFKKTPQPLLQNACTFLQRPIHYVFQDLEEVATYRSVPLRPSGISGFASEFLYFSLGLEKLFCG